MKIISIFFILMIQTCVSLAVPAKNTYQVDLIILAHADAPPAHQEILIPPKLDQAQLLSRDHKTDFYTLLPNTASYLQSEYYSLRNKPQYQILAHYSWKQPAHKSKKLLLKPASQNGWNMEGIISLVQNQYYVLNTQLLIATEDNQHRFIFTKKERLKPNNLYYLDSPNAGMFIRIQA